MAIILVIVKGCILFLSACRFCSVLPSNSAVYVGRVMAAVDVKCNIIIDEKKNQLDAT
jgi:hypothetical protein